MCLLISIRGVDPDYPLLIANNRDERRDRKAAPPGLFLGQRRRMISPRDRLARGTWSAINDLGMFAGITNLGSSASAESVVTETTRGELPHLALDHDDPDAAVTAVLERVAGARFRNFQLLVASPTAARVVVHCDGKTEVLVAMEPVLVLSNEHRLGALAIPGLAELAEPGLAIEARLQGLQALLLDPSRRGGHRILKQGGEYGTVASSLIAVPEDPRSGLIWRYAVGEPNRDAYRNYGNLARRLAGAESQ